MPPETLRCLVEVASMAMTPVYIRKGVEVVYNVNIMHRRKDTWGDDANEFPPQRWVGSKHGWEYLPFNGGPRI